MEHFYKKIDGYFNFEGLYKKYANDLQNGSVFVELGSWKGRSIAYITVEIVNLNKDVKIYAIDTWQGTMNSEVHQEEISKLDTSLYDHFLSNISPAINHIIPMKSDSSSASSTFLDESIDIIFIDADHSYESVKNDILKWYPKIKQGGIISGHDYGEPCGVQQAVDEIFGNRVGLSGTCWIVKK